MNGEPIMEVPPRRTVQTGIQYRVLVAGLVPQVEERDSARHNGYTWKEWQVLHYRERVDGVAYYRLSRAIDMHKEEAVTKAQERKSRSVAKRR